MSAAATPLPRPRATRRIRPAAVGKHLFLTALAVMVAFPFYWMVTTAFKSFFEATQFPPTLVPREWHFENFPIAWAAAPWGRYFANTILIAAVVTVGELATAVLAAYAFALMRFRGKGVVFVLFLATLMIPGEATLIPNFVLMSRRYLNLYDTYWAQILPFLATAFSIFLLRQFFLSVPNELQDAARMDGAGHLRFLWSVVLPISVPALVTVALITFLGSYNSFLWPLIVTSSADVRPVQIGMAQFRTENGSQYHLLMAAATLVIAPVVLLYIGAQRYLIQGVARSGIRG
ncbi:MAG: carbohydrate ABC transporter permease [Candidatus Limnocylindria bacterium]